MTAIQDFFEKPILNSPYEQPNRHWELDEDGQPTLNILESRRRSELITPVPKPKKRRQKNDQSKKQQDFMFDSGDNLSDESQAYNPTPIINELRQHVDAWRNLKSSEQWLVTPDTARLLEHWRHHRFQGIQPFFCQIEAVETAIWLAEVAPKIGKRGKVFIEHITGSNAQANPELIRIALKLATGAGKNNCYGNVDCMANH